MKKLTIFIIVSNLLMTISIVLLMKNRIIDLQNQIDKKNQQIKEMLTLKQSMEVYKAGYKVGSYRMYGKSYADAFFDNVKFKTDSLLMVREIKKALDY